MKNRILSFCAAIVMMTAFCISSFAADYYSSDESGDKTIPDSIASISVSEEGVSIPESAKENTYELTPEGNLTLVDDYYEQSESDDISQKQFLTVTTKAGNTFYIIVDRDGNEDNVYLLNLVDEADLMALINDEEVTIPTTKEAETTEAEGTSEGDENEDETDTEKSGNLKLFVIVAILGGGGFAFYWFKVKNKEPKVDNADNNTADKDDDDLNTDDIFDKESEDNSNE